MGCGGTLCVLLRWKYLLSDSVSFPGKKQPLKWGNNN